MCELVLLDSLLDECEKYGFSFSLEYSSGKYITGDGQKGQGEPGYRIMIGMFGHEGLYRSRHEAIVLSGPALLQQAKEFNYDAYADELIKKQKGE